MVLLLLLLGSTLAQVADVADAKALHLDQKVGISNQLAGELLLLGQQMGKRLLVGQQIKRGEHQPGGRLRILKRPWMPGGGPSWHMMVRNIERNGEREDSGAGEGGADTGGVGSSLARVEEGLRDRRRATGYGVVPFYFRLG